MRSGGINFNYFLKNKLTKLANFVQFKRMLMFCLEDWGAWAPLHPLSTSNSAVTDRGLITRKPRFFLSSAVLTTSNSGDTKIQCR